ncbi:MAG: cyclic nucleotide-binding domain-containing protein [Pseudomonadota bacterium]
MASLIAAVICAAHAWVRLLDLMKSVENKEAYRHVLERLPALAALSSDEREFAMQRGEVVAYASGESVFRQGEWDDYDFFLIEGEIDTFSGGERIKNFAAHRDAAEPLAPGQPRAVTAKATQDAVVFRLPSPSDDDALLEPPGLESRDRDAEHPAVDPGDKWIDSLLASELFRRIPSGNTNRVVDLMEPLEVSAGDVIIRQGTNGDFFFYIRHGSALVTRSANPRASQVKLAELGPGASVGEEALISDAKRSATVSMLTDGLLMRLSKKNFNRLIRDPALDNITFSAAQDLVNQGRALWLDVREPEDHEESGIAGSINMPFDQVRRRRKELTRDLTYIVYCDTGRQSAAAAFLLTEAGLQASYLAKGLIHSLRNLGRTQTTKNDPTTIGRAGGQASLGTSGGSDRPADDSLTNAPTSSGVDSHKDADAKLLYELERNAALEKELAAKTDALEQLKGRVNEGQAALQEDVETARAEAKAAQFELNRLLTELAESQAAAHADANPEATSEREVARYKAEVVSLRHQLAQKRDQERDHEPDQETADAAEPSPDEVATLTEALSAANAELGKRHRELEHQVDDVRRLEEEIERLNAVRELEQAERGTLDAAEVSASRAEQAAVESERDELRRERDALSSSLSRERNERAGLEQRVTTTESLESELRIANEALAKAHAALSNERTRAEQLERQIDQAETDFEALQASLSEARDAEQRRATSEQQSLEALRADAETLRVSLESTRHDAATLREEADQQHRRHLAALEGAEARAAQLEQENDQLSTARLRLEKELGAATAHSDQIEAELRRKTDAIGELEQSTVDGEEREAALRESLQDAHADVSRLQSELEAATDQAASKNAEMSETSNVLTEELDAAKTALATAERATSDAQSALAASRANYEGLQQRFDEQTQASEASAHRLRDAEAALTAALRAQESLQAEATAREGVFASELDAAREAAALTAQTNQNAIDPGEWQTLKDEHERLEQHLLETEIVVETERARARDELARMQRQRDEASERLRAERRAMALEAKEVDQQLQLALKLRSEAEAAMQSAVQLVKERGVEPATVSVGVVDEHGQVRPPKRGTE